MYKLLFIAMMTIFMAGCGGGSSSSSKIGSVQKNSTTKVGYLIDSAVSGVEYSCGKIGGITGKDGEFLYNSSCKIVFKVGSVILGEIDASSINSDQKVIPADIVGVSRDNVTNEKIVCMIQFLQSLDKDNNPNNNIEISQSIRNTLANTSLDFSTNLVNATAIENIVLFANKNLVSKEDALRHYKDILKNNLNIDVEKDTSTITSVEKELVKEVKVEKEILPVLLSESENNSSINHDNESTVDTQERLIVLPSIISSIETVNIIKKNNVGFSYANQRIVNIEILALPTLFNKQVLFFESLKMITTPVGEVENLENKILSTVFNKEGKLDIEYTFANHITSIWMVVPFYGIQMEIPIVNDRIYITLNEGESL